MASASGLNSANKLTVLSMEVKDVPLASGRQSKCPMKVTAVHNASPLAPETGREFLCKTVLCQGPQNETGTVHKHMLIHTRVEANSASEAKAVATQHARSMSEASACATELLSIAEQVQSEQASPSPSPCSSDSELD